MGGRLPIRSYCLDSRTGLRHVCACPDFPVCVACKSRGGIHKSVPAKCLVCRGPLPVPVLCVLCVCAGAQANERAG